jgi:hypothetical protein
MGLARILPPTKRIGECKVRLRFGRLKGECARREMLAWRNVFSVSRMNSGDARCASFSRPRWLWLRFAFGVAAPASAFPNPVREQLLLAGFVGFVRFTQDATIPKLSDNQIGDRLHAAIEVIGTGEGETVRGNTALIAARQSLSLLKGS